MLTCKTASNLSDEEKHENSLKTLSPLKWRVMSIVLLLFERKKNLGILQFYSIYRFLSLRTNRNVPTTKDAIEIAITIIRSSIGLYMAIWLKNGVP